MKLKKVVSICLVGALAAALLAGCGSSSESESASEAEETETAAEEAEEEEAEAAAEEEETEEAAEEAENSVAENGDIVEIEVYTLSYNGQGVEEVEAAVNEISEAEIGVHANLHMIEMGSYQNQLSLMFSAGEPMDLVFAMNLMGTGFSGMVAQNELMPINDLLPEYAPDVYELVGKYLDAMTINGNIYGVPGCRVLNQKAYYIMRADILEDLGLTELAENASSWSDIETILHAVQDSNNDDEKVANIAGGTSLSGVTTPEWVLAGADDWSEAHGIDSLGDTYRLIAVDEDTDTVYCYFESEEYYEMISRVAEWYDEGLVYKDAAISIEDIQQLMASDVIFSMMLGSNTGVEATTKTNTGYDVICPVVTEIPLSTSSVTDADWGVPVTATEPEAALKFLNLMYTNADVENLLVWGIEGRDYELNDQGEAVILDSVVYMHGDYMWGNQFLAYPAEGQGSDFREITEAEFNSCEVSPYLGCTVDTSEIGNELTALGNVIDKYESGYESGSTPPPATYEEYLEGDFIKELESAGLQIVLDHYQEALDEWLASK